jgi:hypothetical protein
MFNQIDDDLELGGYHLGPGTTSLSTFNSRKVLSAGATIHPGVDHPRIVLLGPSFELRDDIGWRGEVLGPGFDLWAWTG